MLSLVDIIVYCFGTICLFFWLLLFFSGLKYSDLFSELSEKEYPLKDIYIVGYSLLQLTKYSYRSKNDRKLRKELGILYDEKYADYYIRVTHSQQIAIALTVLCLAAPLYGLADNLIILGLVIVVAATMYYYYGTAVEKRISKRSDEMLSDFAEVVSKLALLTNAGMFLRDAWKEVAYSGESSIYKEMQQTVLEINSGSTESEAFYRFGSRCVIPEVKKLTSTIAQGLLKSNAELSLMLEQQSKEAWMLKKQNVKRQGEKAASKLLIPILIMFIGILVMIIVPIFSNLGL